MGSIKDTSQIDGLRRLRTMKVRSLSPDESVSVNVSLDAGLELEFDPSLMQSQTDESLSHQVSLAVNGAQGGVGMAFGKIFSSASDHDIEAAPTRAARQQARLQDLAQQINVVALSASRRVRAELSGIGGVEFTIRPGTLRSIGNAYSDLAMEIKDAYRSAQSQYTQRVTHLREELNLSH